MVTERLAWHCSYAPLETQSPAASAGEGQDPRLSAATDTNSCTEYTKKHSPMFVSAGLSLLYDVWPKPVRPVLFCLHLWDLHDLQQRGWHRFNGGVPAPGSLRRRGHDDTGSRASPGWVEGGETRCGGRGKKGGGEKAAKCAKNRFFLRLVWP